MKKILIIFLVLFIHTNTAKATEYKNTASFGNKDSVRDFNQWLYDNDHHQYLTIKKIKNVKLRKKKVRPGMIMDVIKFNYQII